MSSLFGGAAAGAKESASTQQRKDDHIRINLEQDVYGREVTTGFERYRFVHNALPEMDLHEIDLAGQFLGHPLQVPILISSMTGGTSHARDILRNLAIAAEEVGCALGVGSQRAAIENASLEEYYDIRDVAPNALVFANLGAVQLNYGIGVDGCRRAVELLDADALILHLNSIQEAVQIDGNQDFSGLLDKIGEVCDALDVPVIVKEVGFGISGDVASRLAERGVMAIDTSGAGGTSWSAVEAHRAGSPLHRALGEAFVGWGIPTSESLRMVRETAPGTQVIASGGMRNGVDAAKAIALGADLVGFAGPLLRVATQSASLVIDQLEIIREQLRLAMFGVGARDVPALRSVDMLGPDGTILPPRLRDHDFSRTQPFASDGHAEGARNVSS
jgi:isopentenyl-diphosphate Delta-isomerase